MERVLDVKRENKHEFGFCDIEGQFIFWSDLCRMRINTELPAQYTLVGRVCNGGLKKINNRAFPVLTYNSSLRQRISTLTVSKAFFQS